MELYHLRTFVTVAEEGHLTRAAERLHTSQPAISAHIKALEEEFGVQLFQRTPKGMRLSGKGQLLLPGAQQTLASAAKLQYQARGLSDELVGRLSIGLNTDAGFLQVAETLSWLSARYPRLQLEFLSGQTSTNIPAVRAGTLDAAFICGECDDARLQCHELAAIRLKIAAPSSLAAKVGGASVAELARLPWIYTSPDCAYFEVMRGLFERHCCKPAKMVVSNDEAALRAMIRAGVGVGIMREDELREAVADGYAFGVDVELPRVRLQLVHRADRADEPVIGALLEGLTAIWREADPEKPESDGRVAGEAAVQMPSLG